MVNTTPIDMAINANLSTVDYLTCALRSKGALDITQIDLNGKTDIADAMIIVTGTSSRHVSSLADFAGEELEALGLTVFDIDGKDKGEWVLVDSADIIVHVFKADMRETIALERMWAEDGLSTETLSAAPELVM